MKPLLALLAFTNAASAACLPDEETFMSCQIENSTKILRVCFDDITAVYRFGSAGQTPDLELSEPVATLDYAPWPGVGRSIAESVQFQNDGYTYSIFAGFERMFGDEEYEDIPHRSFGGVTVRQSDTTLTSLICARETVDFAWGEGLWTAKQNLGFAWNTRTLEWVELPD